MNKDKLETGLEAKHMDNFANYEMDCLEVNQKDNHEDGFKFNSGNFVQECRKTIHTDLH